MAHSARILEIRSQIRPLVEEVLRPGCSEQRKQKLIEELIPLYNTLFALQEELDLN